MDIKQFPPKDVQDTSRIVHQGGESPSFGPVRRPK